MRGRTTQNQHTAPIEVPTDRRIFAVLFMTFTTARVPESISFREKKRRLKRRRPTTLCRELLYDQPPSQVLQTYGVEAHPIDTKWRYVLALRPPLPAARREEALQGEPWRDLGQFLQDRRPHSLVPGRSVALPQLRHLLAAIPTSPEFFTALDRHTALGIEG
jgi:hypothetical protein